MSHVHQASLFFVALLLPASLLGQFNIATAAGGGPNNVSGTAAAIATPSGLAIDSAGNVYFSSAPQHRVFKWSTNGNVQVVAGYGSPDFTGDGGPAVAAGLQYPRGLALNTAGTALFIADSENAVVRRVDLSTGIITTIAGTPGTFGALGDGGPAANAQLNYPLDVAVDTSGNLYIADTYNHKIRRVDSTNQVISTFAGTGTPGSSTNGVVATSVNLRYPSSVAVHTSGAVYVADTENHKVLRIAGGICTTYAGNGTEGAGGNGGDARNASLSYPSGVRTDVGGNVLIADQGNHRVRKVLASTSVISPVAGTGLAGFAGDGISAVDAKLYAPVVAAADSAGNVYIADYFNYRIRRVLAAGGTIGTLIGTGTYSSRYGGDGAPASEAVLHAPKSVVADPAGNLFIADTNNNRVRRVDAITGTITTYAGTGVAGWSGDGGAAISATLNAPAGLALDSASNLYIADSGNDRVRRVTPTGIISTFAGSGVPGSGGDNGPAAAAELSDPTGLAVDSTGALLIADTSNHRVRRVSPDGIITKIAGSGVAGFGGDGGDANAAHLLKPSAVAVSTAGLIYIADRGNHRIRQISGGTISTYAGTGVAGFSGDGAAAAAAMLDSPGGLGLDAVGNLYIADWGNHRIRRVLSTTGTISTVAGKDEYGFAGDGASATNAKLFFPEDVDVAANGKLFVADSQNDRVRVLTSNCTYSLSANSATLSSSAQGPYAILVSAGGGCVWGAATDNPSWLQLTSAPNGSGSGTVFFSVSANTGISRTGRLTIAGHTYAVTQNSGCTYTLSATAASLTSAVQGPYSIQLTTANGCPWTAQSNDPSWLTLTSNAAGASSGFTYFSVAANPGVQRTGTLTVGGHTYTVTQYAQGQIPATQPSKGVVFRSGNWIVDRNNSFGWDAGDSSHFFGAASDKPITGDWTNSGIIRMGVFRDGVWYLDINNNAQWDGATIDAIASFGTAGDIPVVGDWTGNGRMRIGVFRNGAWILDLNEDRTWNGLPIDAIRFFGTTGDIPVVGDWTGTGRMRIGIFREGLWVVDVDGNNAFDGASIDSFFTFGMTGDKPVAGDWTGTGRRRIGIFRGGLWVIDLNGSNSYEATDGSFTFGAATDQPATF